MSHTRKAESRERQGIRHFRKKRCQLPSRNNQQSVSLLLLLPVSKPISILKANVHRSLTLVRYILQVQPSGTRIAEDPAMMGSLIKNPLDGLDHGLGSWSLGSQAVRMNDSFVNGRMQEMDVERDREGRSKRSDPCKLGDFSTRRQERDWLVRLARMSCIIDVTHQYSV